jgi:hypothetical protein
MEPRILLPIPQVPTWERWRGKPIGVEQEEICSLTKTDTRTDARQLADSKFKKKEMQLLDGRMAMAEYEAARRALSENTARLRALRMARDAAAGLAASENATAARLKKNARSEKSKR